MGRKRSSPVEDLMDLVALLPWWGGVALAVVSYALLHRIAGQEVVATSPHLMTTVWSKGLATAGQYIVPIICLVGAIGSAIRRHQRQTLLANATANRAADALDGMTWREFEMLVGQLFRARGYRVLETGGQGPDGGVDLVLIRAGEKFLVQCKQWKALRVGVDVIRELYGVMAAKGVAGGFVLTSGRFTEEAAPFAAGRNVELVDGTKLNGWISGLRTPTKSYSTSASPEAPPSSPPADVECPVCGKAMVRRIAKQGPNKGGAFWGCSGYPPCRGTRSIT